MPSEYSYEDTPRLVMDSGKITRISMVKEGTRIKLNRRQFLKNKTLALLALAASPWSLFAAARKRPPNILWIYIEDQDPRHGCYGERLVNTPNIDALAQEGTLFERAYVPSPVCSPCRSAIITGSYAVRLGIHNQRSSRDPSAAIHLPEGLKTVPEVFRNAGYFTFNRGKDDYNFMYDRSKLYSTGNRPKVSGKAAGGKGKGAGIVQVGGGDWRECPKDIPFFAQYQLSGGKHAHSKDMAARLTKAGVTAIDPNDVTVPPQYPDTAAIRYEIARHLDTMHLTDHEVGQMVTRLKADGLWENTVIFLFSDHGSYMPRSKQFCYEEGLHVPFMVVAPGMKETVQPGTVRRELTGVLDVAATSLALAGVAIPDYMDARNLFAKGTGRGYLYATRDRCEWAIDRIRSVMGERYHYIRNFMTDRPLWQHNYRMDWPFIKEIEQMYKSGELTPAQAAPFAKRVKEELYDLQNDPHEVRNLAGDPEHRETLSKMNGLMQAWIEETGDKGQYPISKAELRAVKNRYGKLCISPEFQSL
ncbi:MAG: sulfatase [Pseudomonadales bacterium]|nr:sulfatase [Pseudomonadales bacterium]MDP7597262.1 sulfatase [Pseudomonadales bacterium]HJN50268.1 sulfatase [Pseudomonadales bacterium]